MSSAGVGRVRSVNPAKREVRVTPRPGFEGALNGRSEVEFVLADGKHTVFAVDTVEEQNRCVKLTLAEETSANDVASLRGASVIADAVARTPDDPFQVAASDYVGFTVRDLKGNTLGVVCAGFNTPAHGVIEIERAGGSTVLAPFVPEVIAKIDVAARRIVLGDAEAHIVDSGSGGAMT